MRKLPFSILKRLNLWFRRDYSLVKRQGLYWVLNKNNWIDNRLLCFRGYEAKNVKLLKHILSTHQFDSFYDIGANIGFFTLHVARWKCVTHIHAFEPIARNYNQLCANVLVNGFSQSVIAHKYALSDVNADIPIHYNLQSTGIATLNPEKTQRSEKDYEICETIQSIRFDDVHTPKDQICFVKMDVEQHEVQALSGMKKFFARNKVALILEINHKDTEIETCLKKLGLTQIDAPTDTDDYIFANFDLQIS